MNKRMLCLLLLTLNVGAASGNGAPVLLASYETVGGGGVAPRDDPRVQFILELHADDSFPPGPRLGEGIFWADGDSGLLEFTARSDPDFAELVSLATNGINDQFTVFTLYADGRGGGGGGFESRLFDRNPSQGETPDLAGYRIELIRLLIGRVEFEPWPEDREDGYFVTSDLRYEFYGTIVPEPGTVAFLLGGSIGMAWRSKR